jgi:hypothetical protein
MTRPSARSATVVLLGLLAVAATPLAQMGWDSLAGGSLDGILVPVFAYLLPAATVTVVPACAAALLGERPAPATVTGLVFGASLILATLLRVASVV